MRVVNREPHVSTFSERFRNWESFLSSSTGFVRVFGTYRLYSGPRPPKPRTFLMRRKKVVTKDGPDELSHYGGRRVVLSVARPHCVAYGWCRGRSKVA